MGVYHFGKASHLANCHPLYPIQSIQCRKARECEFIDELVNELKRRVQRNPAISRRLQICMCTCDPMLQKDLNYDCPDVRGVSRPIYDILVVKKVIGGSRIRYSCYEVELKTTMGMETMSRVREKFDVSCATSILSKCHSRERVVVYSKKLKYSLAGKLLSKGVRLMREDMFLEELLKAAE